MKTHQVNFRIEADLLDALQREADAECIDRTTMIRKLLREGMTRRRIERALLRFQRDEISLGRACEDAGLSHWAMLDLMNERGIIPNRETLDEAEVRLERLLGKKGRVAETAPRYPASGRPEQLRTLAESGRPGEVLRDRPPRRGGILLVGINPSPTSVAAGHYWQGSLGRRLWKRLAGLGLLPNATPGREDEAFIAAGNGLTDLVKRPTRSAGDLSAEEMRVGVEVLRLNVGRWSPKLVIFVFSEAARAALGRRSIAPGPGPAFEGAQSFLLSGPYAVANERQKNDAALLNLLGTGKRGHGCASQRITANDIRQGCIRLPREAKALFPKSPGDVELILRGLRLRVPYDPRVGPARERSARLRIGNEVLERMVRVGERLHAYVSQDGRLHLD